MKAKKKFIIGLGNPVAENYSGTRHNVGFDVLFELVPQSDFLHDKYSSSLVAETVIDDVEVMIILPQTYMNHSGDVIFGIDGLQEAFDTGDVLVVHDEIDIPFGSIKISHNSGSGGHNGIKSLIKKIGNHTFDRLRIGVSPIVDEVLRKPVGEGAVSRFVLQKFNTAQNEQLHKEIFPESIRAIRVWLKDGAEIAANKFNGPKV